MANLNQSYLQEGKKIVGSPNGVEYGEIGNKIYNTDGDEFESSGGTTWRLTKDKGVNLFSREFPNLNSILTLTDLELNENIYIKDRDATLKVIKDSKDYYINIVNNNVDKRDYVYLVGSDMVGSTTLLADTIITVVLRVKSGSTIPTYPSTSIQNGVIRVGVMRRSASDYGIRVDSPVGATFLSCETEDGDILDGLNPPTDTWLVCKYKTISNITISDNSTLGITLSYLANTTNLSDIDYKLYSFLEPNGRTEVFDFSVSSGTNVITGSNGSLMRYEDRNATEPEGFLNWLEDPFNADNYITYEIDNKLLKTVPKPQGISPTMIGYEAEFSISQMGVDVAPWFQVCLDSEYDVFFEGGFYYLNSPVYANKAKKVVLKGSPNTRDIDITNTRLTTIYTGTTPFDLIHIGVEGFNFYGGVIDVSNTIYDPYVLDYTPPKIITYHYRYNLIQAGDINTTLIGSAESVKKYDGGHIGYFFDGSRENPNVIKSGTIGEIHDLNLMGSASYLWAVAVASAYSPWQEYPTENLLNDDTGRNVDWVACSLLNFNIKANKCKRYYLFEFDGHTSNLKGRIQPGNQLTYSVGGFYTPPKSEVEYAAVDLNSFSVKSDLFGVDFGKRQDNLNFKYYNTGFTETTSGVLVTNNTDPLLVTEIKINKLSSLSYSVVDMIEILQEFLPIKTITIKISNTDVDAVFTLSNIVDDTTHYTLTVSPIVAETSGVFVDYSTSAITTTLLPIWDEVIRTDYLAPFWVVRNNEVDNELLSESLIDYKIKGQIKELVPIRSTSIIIDNLNTLKLDNFKSNTGQKHFISELHDKLFLADKRSTVEVKWYKNLGSFNTKLSMTGQEGLVTEDPSLGSTSPSLLYRMFSYDSYSRFTYGATFDEDNDFVEITLTDFTTTGLYKIVEFMRVYLNFSYTQGLNTIPNGIYLENSGSIKTVNYYTDVEDAVSSLYIIEDLGGAGTTSKLTIRLIGTKDKTLPIDIRRIAGTMSGSFEEDLPYVTIAGGQKILGDLTVETLHENKNNIISTTISLDSPTGRSYNLYSPSSSGFYSVENLKVGGTAVALVNRTSSTPPIVSGSTLRADKSDTFILNKTFRMHLLSIDGVNVEHWFELVEEYLGDTGTNISLDKTSTRVYNMSSASSATTYTTSNLVVGGNSICLINATTEPVITGATKVKGSTFIPNTNMHMAVWYYGVVVQYNFIEL